MDDGTSVSPSSTPPLRWKRVLLATIATACLLTATVLFILYWNPLVGQYQLTFLFLGLVPILGAIFAVLFLWVRRSQQDAYRRYLAESGNLTKEKQVDPKKAEISQKE